MILGINKRYMDNLDRNRKSSDFVRRRISPSILQVILIYGAAATVVMVIAQQSSSLFISAASILLTFSGLGAFFYIIVLRAHDIIMANEFQNAILAGSAGAGTEFSVIVKNDNTAVYCNPGFYKYFSYSQSSIRDIGILLANIGIEESNIQNITRAIDKLDNTKIDAELISLDGEKCKVAIILEHIKRPKGYASLRAIRVDSLIEKAEKTEAESFDKNLVPELLENLPFGAWALV